MSEFLNCKICQSKIEKINEKYNLAKCSSCELIFSKSIFSEEEIVTTYDMLYNKTSQYENHGKEFSKLKENKSVSIGRPKSKVLNYILKNNIDTIVEIGAGVGIVANYLKNNKVSYLGFELDSNTAKKAKSLGLNIEEGDFSNLDNLKDGIDAIVAFEVVEHLQDLNLFFELIEKKIKSKGFFGFTVPNYHKRLNYKSNSDKIYQSGPPIHLNFFTKESIENIAKIYNFDIEFCEVKKFPYLNLNKFDTYKFFLMAMFGKFHGATIMCVLRKK